MSDLLSQMINARTDPSLALQDLDKATKSAADTESIMMEGLSIDHNESPSKLISQSKSYWDAYFDAAPLEEGATSSYVPTEAEIDKKRSKDDPIKPTDAQSILVVESDDNPNEFEQCSADAGRVGAESKSKPKFWIPFNHRSGKSECEFVLDALILNKVIVKWSYDEKKGFGITELPNHQVEDLPYIADHFSPQKPPTPQKPVTPSKSNKLPVTPPYDIKT